jgi:hypothetical protein
MGKRFWMNTVGFLSRSNKNKKKIATSNSIKEEFVEILVAGDMVRVRSRDDILETLDHWGALKGCAFLPEMESYCGTTQRILKRVNRFVDERDFQVKKSKGILLLEGIMCSGTSFYGPCDRSCFYFWREEWLEKVEGEKGAK